MTEQLKPIFSYQLLSFTMAIVLATGVLFSNTAAADEAKADIVVVLDLSGSMKSNGSEERFDAFFRWVSSFVAPSDRIGVVAMGHGAELVAPLTTKEDFTFGDYAEKLKKRAKYTDVAAGLENAYYELKTNSAPGAKRIILLFSDAQIDMPKGLWDLENSMRYLQNSLIPAMKRENVKILSIVPQGLKANFPLLQELANGTDGVYYRGLPQDAVAARITHLKADPTTPQPEVKKSAKNGRRSNAKQVSKPATSEKGKSPQKVAVQTQTVQPTGKASIRMEVMVLGAILLVGFALVFGAIFVLFKRSAPQTEYVHDDMVDEVADEVTEELMSVLEDVQSLKQESRRSDLESKQYMTEEDSKEELNFGEPQEKLSVSLVAPFLDYENIISEHPNGPTDEILSKPVFSMEETEDSNLSVSNMETLIGTGIEDLDEEGRGEQ